MKLSFWGGARTTTGSKHLLKVNGNKILLDCGLFQGHREESDYENRNLPFSAEELHAVLLSHAHIDHSGNLPTLVRNGYHGPIFATPATVDLCRVMLRDSAFIQEKDIEFLNKIRNRKGLPPKEPIYTLNDAENAINLLKPAGYDAKLPVADGVEVVYRNAGHILGSALLELDLKENSHTLKLAYSGDLGRKFLPLLKEPYQLKECDALIIESTYGNRQHHPVNEIRRELTDIVTRVHGRKGKIIIPAFSVGRSQELTYTLNGLINDGKIPDLPIFVDSPLTVNVTEVFMKHPECFNEDICNIKQPGCDPFGLHRIKYIEDVEESKKLNGFNEPCIIISASGMCESGRILHHLKNNIENPKNVVLIVGYQAEGTLGRRLVEKAEHVKIFGEEYVRRAEVVVINAFSAHADKQELLRYLEGIKERPKKTFIVHGELDQSEGLAQEMKSRGFIGVYIPERGEEVTI